jgi:predicted PurR-regulated permease PerM/CheY-like chemotaxis protein
VTGSRSGATGASPRLVTLAGLVLVVACLYLARAVFIPIAVALLITFLLSPLVGLARRLGTSQVPAVGIVVSLALLLTVGLGWGLFTQLSTLADDLPAYRATIARKIADVQRFGRKGPLKKVEDTAKDVMQQLERTTPSADRPLPVVVSPPHPLWQLPRVIEPLGSGAFVLVLVVLMLLQQRELRARVIRLFGHERLAETTRALDEASERISRYLLTQCGLNTCFGAAVGIGLFLLDVPFALVWGFFAALLRFIPYVGAWVAALVPVVMSLAFFDGWVKPLLIAGLFAVTEVVIAFFLEPYFFGRSAGVSPLALLIAAGFWAWLWGPIGLALATPLTVWLVVFSRTVAGLEFIEILMSDEPAVAPYLTYYQRVLAEDEQEAFELVAEASRASSVGAAFDTILVPALARARHDREADHLTRVEYAHVIESTRQVLERAARGPDDQSATPPRPETSSVVVAGCPVHDEADRIALAMLSRLLEPGTYSVQSAAAGGLVSELTASVHDCGAALICVSALEGRGHTRHLVKRLRSTCPEIPILVGCWGLRDPKDARAELVAAGADDVVITLAEACVAVARMTDPASPRTTGWPDLEPATKEVP